MKLFSALLAVLTLGLGICGGAMAFGAHAAPQRAEAPALHGDCEDFACGLRAA